VSYARFGSDGSDVYVFADVAGGIECCGCVLQEREWVDDPDRPLFKGYLKAVGAIVPYHFDTAAEMLAHLASHVAAGHTVPASCTDRIAAEADWIDHRPSEAVR
jgi:hypothetical protein